MNCCMPSDNSKNKEHLEHGKEDNMQRIVLVGIIVLLVIALGYMVFFNGKTTGEVVQNTGGGESYEEMMSRTSTKVQGMFGFLSMLKNAKTSESIFDMLRMHPEQVQQTANAQLSNIPSMIGGC